MSDFLAMGGYAFYVWTSFGVVLLVMLVTAAQAIRRHHLVVRQLARSLDGDTRHTASRRPVHRATLHRERRESRG